ncbi:MAG: hypothetical protein RL322_1406 [Pseudomonadota bacterium]|jgi:apolipoprotein D and lipocalin family protein
MRLIPRGLVVALIVVTTVFAGCTGLPRGVEPVTDFDVQRYQGEWFEIMRLDHRFERGLTHVTARYSLDTNGTVTVVNGGFDPVACRWRSAEARARFINAPSTASLAVTFFWPFAGGYHVVDLDRHAYQWAMVAGPTHSYLWILARTPELDPSILSALIQRAQGLGFPTNELIRVAHGPTTCKTP